MGSIGELVLTRNQILQFKTEREDGFMQARSVKKDLSGRHLEPVVRWLPICALSPCLVRAIGEFGRFKRIVDLDKWDSGAAGAW